MTSDLAAAPLLLALSLAFVGGLLSFLSPCVLPLVPAYLGHLAGASISGARAPSQTGLVRYALAFVLGFALVFTIAGLAVGLLIGWLQVGLDLIRVVGGVAVIVMGLHTAGWVTVPFLFRQARIDGGSIQGSSIRNSLLLGVVFAAGWSPCIGTILTGIFALAAARTAHAGLLFFVYSLGLGLPFIGAALVMGRFTSELRRMNAHARAISKVSGIFLIVVGVLLVTNTFGALAALGPPIEPFGG